MCSIEHMFTQIECSVGHTKFIGLTSPLEAIMSITALEYLPTTAGSARHLFAVPAPRETQAGLRLTRRGRIVLFLAALAAIILLGITLGDSTIATSQSGTPAASHTITVKAGETLWQIAAEANPRGDIRQTVDDIMKLNSLTSAAGLQMGREIAVPVYAK